MNFGVPEVIVFLIGQVVVAAAIWGGIRADVKSIHERLDEVKRIADRAHARLDDFIMNRTNNGGRL